MKRIILEYLILLTTVSCSKMVLSGDVCSKMDDIKFKNYCYEHFDSNGDGKVSKEEAESVREIVVSDNGIYSLKGIEYFKNLRVLDCGMNEITSLDLTHNTQLTELDCSYCWLNNLVISKNKQLDVLDCKSCGLKTLDVSNNTELSYLTCSENKLSSLDISTLPNLNRYSVILGQVLGYQEDDQHKPIILTVYDKREYWKDSSPYQWGNWGNIQWVLQ